MDYTASYSFNDLEQHIGTLLLAQQKLAKSTRTESTYCIVLNQRLTLLKRILYAYSAVRYESKDKVSWDFLSAFFRFGGRIDEYTEKIDPLSDGPVC